MQCVGSSPLSPISLNPHTDYCRAADWTGAQIGNNDTSDDIMKVDLSQIHYLSGPVAVTGAEPGDCLVVDILDGIDPFYSPSRGSSYIDGVDV